MKKRIVAILISVMMVASLVACGSSKKEESAGSSTQSESEAVTTDEKEEEKAEAFTGENGHSKLSCPDPKSFWRVDQPEENAKCSVKVSNNTCLYFTINNESVKEEWKDITVYPPQKDITAKELVDEEVASYPDRVYEEATLGGLTGYRMFLSEDSRGYKQYCYQLDYTGTDGNYGMMINTGFYTNEEIVDEYAAAIIPNLTVEAKSDN